MSKKSRRAAVIPEKPINGLYPTLQGRIYRDRQQFGQVNEYFVADADQGVSEYDSVISGYAEVKE